MRVVSTKRGPVGPFRKKTNARVERRAKHTRPPRSSTESAPSPRKRRRKIFSISKNSCRKSWSCILLAQPQPPNPLLPPLLHRLPRPAGAEAGGARLGGERLRRRRHHEPAPLERRTKHTQTQGVIPPCCRPPPPFFDFQNPVPAPVREDDRPLGVPLRFCPRWTPAEPTPRLIAP